MIVCGNCRRRKIKCDKKSPCSNCVMTSIPHSCKYESKTKSTAPGDEFTMQIQFDMPTGRQNSTAQISKGKGFISQFQSDPLSTVVPQAQHLPNDGAITRLNPPYEHKSNGTVYGQDVTQHKTELQILKERLEQIERSLANGNGQPGSSSTYPKNGAPSPPFNTASAPNLNGHGERLSGSDVPKLTNSSDSYASSGSSASALILSHNYRMGPPPVRQYGSMLPPLSSWPKQDDYENPQMPRSDRFDYMAGPMDMKNTSRNPKWDYTLAPTPKPTAPQNIKEEFLVGKNIVAFALDTINFYEHYSSLHFKDNVRRINFGPFAWSSLMRRDHGLHLAWEQIKLRKENSVALVFADATPEVTQESANTILESEKYPEQSERQFHKRALETDGIDEMIPYSSILKARQTKQKSEKVANTTLLLGLTFYDSQINRELDTIERIRTVLPKKRIIWKLVGRFFTSVYSYMPFLDEGYFRADLERLIGPQSYDDVPVYDLKIEKKMDLATIGILLVLIRLSYLSLLSNNTELTEKMLTSEDPSPQVQLQKYLLSNPISIDTVHVANLCLEQFNFTRRANYTLLQLVLFLRIYHTYAPEDGDGADGGDSQIQGAVLLQMAYQLGLNREPDETCTNLRMNHLTRKIWAFVRYSDLHLAFCFGNPMSVDDRFSNTKAPYYTRVPGDENLSSKLDVSVLDRFDTCEKLMTTLKQLLLETLEVEGRVNLAQLTSKLGSFELKIYDTFGLFKDIIRVKGTEEQATVERNFKVKIYMGMKGLLMSIYFHIYLYYEMKDVNVAFFYFKKCLMILIADVMPHYSDALRNSEVISDMVVNPTLETFIHKSNMLYLSGIVRVNFVIFHLKESADHVERCQVDKSYLSYFQRLCQLSSCLTRAAEYTISAISKISNRYYYAWRITKSLTVFLRNVTCTEFYRANYSKAQHLYLPRYSEAQLEELILLCENTLASFKNSEFSTFGFSKRAETQMKSEYNLSTSSGSPPKGLTDSATDNLWLQILSWKHDLAFQEGMGEVSPETPVSVPSTHRAFPHSIDFDLLKSPGRFAKDPTLAAQFDIFSDIPFMDLLDV